MPLHNVHALFPRFRFTQEYQSLLDVRERLEPFNGQVCQAFEAQLLTVVQVYRLAWPMQGMAQVKLIGK